MWIARSEATESIELWNVAFIGPDAAEIRKEKGGARNFGLVLLVLVPQRLDRMTDDKVKKKANKNSSWQISRVSSPVSIFQNTVNLLNSKKGANILYCVHESRIRWKSYNNAKNLLLLCKQV